MKSKLIFAYLIATLVATSMAYSIDMDALNELFETPEEPKEEMSYKEYGNFMNEWGDYYGYNGKIDEYRANDTKRFNGAAYLDYTGSGVYRESAVKKCFDELENHLYGNAHSRNPSSMLTENNVEAARDLILKYFRADPKEYSVIFTSGATGGLHLVGESFPWTKNSKFYYLHQNHNSVLGIREYAYHFGANFSAIGEEQLPPVEACRTPDDVCREQCFNSMNAEEKAYSLFAYPAEDNFAGVKYPLEWIRLVQNGYFHDNTQWLVLLDAAAFVPTNRLDLSIYKPDFVTMSFYKMFGYPTGLGALLVRNKDATLLNKIYWGGGTVIFASEPDRFCLFHGRPCSRFEDGTVNFLGITSVKHMLKSIEEIGIDNIQRHVYSLTRYLYLSLASLKHSNGNPVVEIYGKHDKANGIYNGGIVSINVKKYDGSYVGYYEIQSETSKDNIHVRTGCHCNPGACRLYLNQDNEQIKEWSKERDSCSDSYDLLDGKPLGAIRISLGYLTNFNDIMKMINFVKGYIDYGKPESI
ncbi:hypothetical protein WA158_001041 [Blastocystis sp. Blastoise]